MIKIVFVHYVMSFCFWLENKPVNNSNKSAWQSGTLIFNRFEIIIQKAASGKIYLQYIIYNDFVVWGNIDTYQESSLNGKIFCVPVLWLSWNDKSRLSCTFDKKNHLLLIK